MYVLDFQTKYRIIFPYLVYCITDFKPLLLRQLTYLKVIEEIRRDQPSENQGKQISRIHSTFY